MMARRVCISTESSIAQVSPGAHTNLGYSSFQRFRTTSQEANLLDKPFEISVNNKPVQVEEPIVTGLEIKQATIDQGVSIDLNFRLVRVEADGKRPPINNSDKVDVREFKTFIATAPDDNA